jgi:predicted esterase
VGYEGLYGRDHLLEHEPDLWETLWGTVGLHPELRVRLIHGESDSAIPLENSVAFEAVLDEAGYDVALIRFPGDHFDAPDDLVVETIIELVE